ncbi:MAG TPA: hypothetical protein VN812_04675 [Candidatus Acidoferrales bacterium]|nr:hypothetical protein [Candidatus Acidoferrales bacterium]
MGSANGMMWRWSVATLAVLIVHVAAAHAFVTTERSSSIIIFPKVISDSSGLQSFPNPSTDPLVKGIPVDTIIQISNTGNSMVYAHCFYVDATPADPTRPPGLANPVACLETDFDIALTKQQPTHWLVSTGRQPGSLDTTPCSVDCSNSGFEPGLIPRVDDPFTGELKCIETDYTGAPISGNHLKGEATIVTLDGKGDASKYNAIGLLGDPNNNNGDDTLCLGGDASSSCESLDMVSGPEYGACPQTVILNQFAVNATDPVIEELGNGPSQVQTEVTLVPCSEDFAGGAVTPIKVQFFVTNEMESVFSGSTTITCWANLRLDSLGSLSKIFDFGTLRSRFAQTQMSARASGSGAGFVGIVEEFHQTSAATGRAAGNLHNQGDRPGGDTINLPGTF